MEPMTQAQQKKVVKNVLAACEDITKLDKAGYNFLYLASGFIAHYNQGGFIDFYQGTSLQGDILRNAHINQWDNFTPKDHDYNYYMAKKAVYNAICEGLKNPSKGLKKANNDKATVKAAAADLADVVAHAVNERAKALDIENPYKAQYLLEELIENLKARV